MNNWNKPMKILLIITCIFLSSCSLYQLRPGEYNTEEPESSFVEMDDFGRFMRRDDRHLQ